MHSRAVGLMCLLCSCIGRSALLGINTEGHQLIIRTKKKRQHHTFRRQFYEEYCTGLPASGQSHSVHAQDLLIFTTQQNVVDRSMHLLCRPDLFALPLSRVSGIQAQAYHLLGWSEPWAPSGVGNSSFMFAESGQFLVNR